MYSRQALLTHTGLPEARTPLYYNIVLKEKNPNKHIVLKKNLKCTSLNSFIGKMEQEAKFDSTGSSMGVGIHKFRSLSGSQS